MAETLSVSLRLSRAGSVIFSRTDSPTVTLAADPMQHDLLSIGTTHEAIPLGDVATNGFAYFKNLDAANYVEIGIVVSATFYPVVKLKAGEVACFRLGAAAPYAKANTGAVKLESWINSD